MADLPDIFAYNPETGAITNRVVRANGKCKIGDLAGTMKADITGKTRRWIRYEGKSYYANVVAWRLMTGEWPQGEVDHINGDSSDDRWSNLRLVTHQQNQFNRCKNKNNTSGFKGVHAHKNRWRARIMVGGKSICLGLYKTREMAHAAYCQAADKMHGEYSNHG